MSSIKFRNAFDAVTDNIEEANEQKILADLMIALRDLVEEKGWKQAEAAEVFKLTQPRVSDLSQGRIDKFSIDLLMTCLHRVGFRSKPIYKQQVWYRSSSSTTQNVTKK